MVPVPRREIHAEAQAVFPAGFRQFLEDIALPVPPAAPGYSVRAGLGRPQAKTVVVFGRDDDAFHAGIPGHLCPLSTVQFCGVEQVLRFCSAAPFGSTERVGAKVHEQVVFHLLPPQLRLRGHGTERLWRARRR